VWRSDDAGKTWRIVSNENNRPMYYSQIRVDPRNPENVYVGGLNYSKSTDGGKTFKSLQQGIAHSDNHAIWIDPANGDHMMVGNDGGLERQLRPGCDLGIRQHDSGRAVYAIGVDMRKPYYVYGGLQDNGLVGRTKPDGATCKQESQTQTGIASAAVTVLTQIDPTDYNIVYAESQGGAAQRIDLRTGRSVSIRPRGVPRAGPGQGGGSGRRRWWWCESRSFTGCFANSRHCLRSLLRLRRSRDSAAGLARTCSRMLSRHRLQQRRFASTGARRFCSHRTIRAWSTWAATSFSNPWTAAIRGPATVDLTKQIDRNTLPIMGVPGKDPMASKHDGYTSYGYVVTIAESPKLPGVIWVGTDDGNVQVSKDGGATWTNVAKNVPGIGDTYHITRVEPSNFDAGTCYLAVDGHRLDDLKPYLFVTTDYGATWKSIVNNLPKWGTVNVVYEDAKNKDLLFVGTEYGLYVSLNGGAEWKPMMSGMPTMRIDDILVHPRDNDLIVGTHGRGIYIFDDISPLQQMSQKVLDSDVHLFEVRPGTIWQNDTGWAASGVVRNCSAARILLPARGSVTT
jgi:photosystem II stability/assembly factor-like uncharacterized protein